ncbi:MAG TPA: alcohol dehydrogenase catalytic domain-containing protein, partial [Myxococcota bacterium]|nr:alcohol dehydrogenase catalytic domain-containing protein [Myxococcota bacterium]
MKAIVYHGKEDFRYESTPDPKILNENDAIVRVTRTAICGSDLHLWHGGLPEGIGAAGGFAVGHEFLGIVEEVGPGVTAVKKGDRVLTSCTVGCGHCALCRRNVFSGCQVMTAGGGATNVFGFSTALPGGQAEAVRVPYADTNLFQVPPEMSEEHALFLTDILPTGYMGAEFAEVSPGDTVVVFGCGPVGTFAQLSCLLRGAARVIAVDLDDGRLERARQLGCDAVNPTKVNLGERVLELTHGVGADAAIEAVGREDLITQAAMVTRPGGRVAVIGVLGGITATLPWFLLFMKNIS